MNRILQATIPRRQKQCASCQKSFVNKQEYHSVLDENNDSQEDKDTFLRRDFCTDCFCNSFAEQKPSIVWKGFASISAKNEPTHDRIPHLIECLKEVMAKPGEAADAFFIALYLARKKAIIFRHEILSPDRRTLWIYEVASTEEMLTIEKVPLVNLQNAQLQKEVLEILQKC